MDAGKSGSGLDRHGAIRFVLTAITMLLLLNDPSLAQQCTSPDDCPEDQPICASLFGGSVCVECTAADQCNGGNFTCTDNRCVEAPRSACPDEGCPENLRCERILDNIGGGSQCVCNCPKNQTCVPSGSGFQCGVSLAPIVIDFSDPAGLLAMPPPYKAAPNTFANSYKEDGMIFLDRIDPPHPQLNWPRAGHYHLLYQDRTITFCVSKTVFGPGRVNPDAPIQDRCVRITNPEQEDRFISPHGAGYVIQLTYDPDNDGQPNAFNLLGLDVNSGRLNVGTISATNRVCSYNDLTAGFRWGLTGNCATNLTRATLEVPREFREPFTVDNIVFEPAVSSLAVLPANKATFEIKEGQTNSDGLDSVIADPRAPILRELADLVTPVFGVLEIENLQVEIRGPAQDKFNMQGTMSLAAGSDGITADDEVLVTLGGFSESIPAELFKCAQDEAGETICQFRGTIGGITKMSVRIAGDKLTFRAEAEGVHLTGIRGNELVPVTVQIGNDFGGMNLPPEKVLAFDH